ncbi:response regulator, partial [Methylobacterium radiotolerans]|uniref:response regulator n=1 Tax=Methylobacterium radiotolerans TaxID=31998 RepID=UPI000D5F32FE
SASFTPREAEQKPPDKPDRAPPTVSTEPAEEPDFDVVFSDVVMPGMGGLALAQELRRRMPRLPVLLASGYIHVLAQDGTHGFSVLHKPYSAEQLGRLLRQVTAPKRDALSTR